MFDSRIGPPNTADIRPKIPDWRPPPWAGLDAKRSGCILLVLAIAAGAMYLFVGWLYFRMITNPTVSEITLYRLNPLGTYNPSIEDLGLYMQLSGLYAISSFAVGFWLSHGLRAVRVERFGRVQLFTIILPLVFCLPGVLLPVAREIALFLPPGMLVFAASNLVHPENRYRPTLGVLGLLTFVPMLLGEVFLVALKPLGAAMMFVVMAALGLSALALVVLAREEHLALLEQGPGKGPVASSAGDMPYPPPLMVIPDKSAPPPAAARRRARPATLIVTAGVAVVVAFLPPLWVLDTDHDLELNWQLGLKGESETGARILRVQAVVVNRGARAAIGTIDVSISYKNRTYPVGSTGMIDGFGSRYWDTNLSVRNWTDSGPRPNITLSFNGRELETQTLRMPALNPVLALAAILVLKALNDRRKGRRAPAAYQ